MLCRNGRPALAGNVFAGVLQLEKFIVKERRMEGHALLPLPTVLIPLGGGMIGNFGSLSFPLYFYMLSKCFVISTRYL